MLLLLLKFIKCTVGLILKGETASSLGSAVDELMRHQPSLRTEATKAIIKVKFKPIWFLFLELRVKNNNSNKFFLYSTVGPKMERRLKINLITINVNLKINLITIDGNLLILFEFN